MIEKVEIIDLDLRYENSRLKSKKTEYPINSIIFVFMDSIKPIKPIFTYSINATIAMFFNSINMI